MLIPWRFYLSVSYIWSLHDQLKEGSKGIYTAIPKDWPNIPVDGNQKSGKLTSWGKGSWNPILYRVLAPSQVVGDGISEPSTVIMYINKSYLVGGFNPLEKC